MKAEREPVGLANAWNLARISPSTAVQEVTPKILHSVALWEANLFSSA